MMSGYEIEIALQITTQFFVAGKRVKYRILALFRAKLVAGAPVRKTKYWKCWHHDGDTSRYQEIQLLTNRQSCWCQLRMGHVSVSALLFDACSGAFRNNTACRQRAGWYCSGGGEHPWREGRGTTREGRCWSVRGICPNAARFCQVSDLCSDVLSVQSHFAGRGVCNLDNHYAVDHVPRPVEPMRRGITYMGLPDQCTGLSCSGDDKFVVLALLHVLFRFSSRSSSYSGRLWQEWSLAAALECASEDLGCAWARVTIHLGCRDLDQPQVLPVLSCWISSVLVQPGVVKDFSTKGAARLSTQLKLGSQVVVN